MDEMDLTDTPMDGLNLLGGRACLDFVNTVDPRDADDSHEYLTSYDTLVAWGVRAELIAADEAKRLRRAARDRPADTTVALQWALALRETMYRVFAAVARGTAVGGDDLAPLNAAIAATMAHARLIPGAGSFTWGWDGDAGALDSLLWSVVRSAGEILTEGDVHRVRECAGERCGWLFLDTSKNGSRRWCSMDSCGNRAKARGYYARSRGAQGANSRAR